MRECVEHFTEGRDAWKAGWVGYFSRLRGFITSFLPTILTTGLPFWWPNSFCQTIRVVYCCIGVAVPLVIAVPVGAFYLRKWRQRFIDTNYFLHELAHNLRDYQTKTYERLLNQKGLERENVVAVRMPEYIANICNDVRECFIRHTNDSTIAVVIRLALDILDNAGEKIIVYRTIGRSKGLNPDRSKTTEDVKSTEGIARYLITKRESHGVLIYNDLFKASEHDTFKITENDRKYQGEICTMMVAPLNAWDGTSGAMIGILYVTSREKNVFALKHVDMMRFIADTVASSIAGITEQLKKVDRMPDLTGREQ